MSETKFENYDYIKSHDEWTPGINFEPVDWHKGIKLWLPVFKNPKFKDTFDFSDWKNINLDLGIIYQYRLSGDKSTTTVRGLKKDARLYKLDYNIQDTAHAVLLPMDYDTMCSKRNASSRSFGEVMRVLDSKGEYGLYNLLSVTECIIKTHLPMHMTKFNAEGKASFFETPDKYMAGRRTLLPIGRYMNRYILSYVHNQGEYVPKGIIEKLSHFIDELYKPKEVFFENDPKEIAKLYMQGPGSCMSYGISHFREYAGRSLKTHPVEVYGGDSDFELAYTKNENGVIESRSIVHKPSKIFIRCYGNYQPLHLGLKREGYIDREDSAAVKERVENLGLNLEEHGISIYRNNPDFSNSKLNLLKNNDYVLAPYVDFSARGAIIDHENNCLRVVSKSWDGTSARLALDRTSSVAGTYYEPPKPLVCFITGKTIMSDVDSKAWFLKREGKAGNYPFDPNLRVPKDYYVLDNMSFVPRHISNDYGGYYIKKEDVISFNAGIIGKTFVHREYYNEEEMKNRYINLETGAFLEKPRDCDTYIPIFELGVTTPYWANNFRYLSLYYRKTDNRLYFDNSVRDLYHNNREAFQMFTSDCIHITNSDDILKIVKKYHVGVINPTHLDPNLKLYWDLFQEALEKESK